MINEKNRLPLVGVILGFLLVLVACRGETPTAPPATPTPTLVTFPTSAPRSPTPVPGPTSTLRPSSTPFPTPSPVPYADPDKHTDARDYRHR
ncbi:MAG: hypothetical protein ACE5GO_04260 [Anaerolineales bacterium]